MGKRHGAVAADLADIEAVKRRIARNETTVFPFELAERILDGERPVHVFREHRGFGPRQLATAAAVSPSYLSEIEAGQKPGSIECLRRVAAALDVSLDLLVRNGTD
jgi:transcriptional regulator with XRE-family HTH domain